MFTWSSNIFYGIISEIRGKNINFSSSCMIIEEPDNWWLKILNIQIDVMFSLYINISINSKNEIKAVV